MREKNEIKVLNKNEEISSIIYACIASAHYVESKNGSLNNYNPINFIIDSLYDLDFKVYPHLNIIPDRGGARYIMNNVSSYRFSKGYKIRSLNTLKDLFKDYQCNNKNDIKKLINLIYQNRYNYNMFDDNITKALYAFKTYYENNIIIQTFPNDIKLYRDYFVNTIKQYNNDSFTDISINSQNSSIHSLNTNHILYPEVKMLILTDGFGKADEYNASYEFIDYMNEWFNKINPYEDNFKEKLENIVCDLNYKIGKNNKSNTSASVVVITEENTYIISAGNTRVHLVDKDGVKAVKRKESFYDEAKENNLILPFSIEYAKSLPTGTIGYKTDKYDKFNSKTFVFPTNMFEGLLITTSDIHNYLSENELNAAIQYNDSDEVLDTLNEIYNLYKYNNGIILWEKKKRIHSKIR